MTDRHSLCSMPMPRSCLSRILWVTAKGTKAALLQRVTAVHYFPVCSTSKCGAGMLSWLRRNTLDRKPRVTARSHCQAIQASKTNEPYLGRMSLNVVRATPCAAATHRLISAASVSTFTDDESATSATRASTSPHAAVTPKAALHPPRSCHVEGESQPTGVE